MAAELWRFEKIADRICVIREENERSKTDKLKLKRLYTNITIPPALLTFKLRGPKLCYHRNYIPTTQAVLRNLKDEFLLEELIKGATRDVDADAQVMNSESSLREKEIEALFPSKASKSFAPPSASAMADTAMIESFPDNADYQPQPYIKEHPTQSQVLGNALEPEENPFVIPDLPIRLPPAKPILLIVPPELIEKWAAEVSEAYQDFKVLIYHGDKRSAWFRMYEKVAAKVTKGKLTRDHPIFNGDEHNSRIIVITSVVIMRSRRGPSPLKNHRMHHLKYTQQDADEFITVSNPN
ncbi:hypothetical protein BHYA_0058g00380 [Botrytis hyacinthi]|uniref:SNF2 N-terminal domain-containing protein n=1 Tax=Botrytis hyacinthi TaxID=278943 RepID=A0A4Z1GQN3_9HELO|nr:hypothetical protein BHYA_0058g00380 [Botrytis hyacinthi]